MTHSSEEFDETDHKYGVKPHIPPWFKDKITELLAEMIAKQLKENPEFYRLACGHDSRLTNFDCPECRKCIHCCTCKGWLK